MKHYMVSAVPYDGHAQKFAVGHRFTPEPVEVTVLAEDDPEDAPRPADRPAYTITPKQLEQLKADKRIRIETSTGRPVNDAAKEAAAAEKAAEDTAALKGRGR